MSIPQRAERARTRYAAPLYRNALLRHPDARRAGRAVVAAFGTTKWDELLIDDQVEARLVANLPPLSRFALRRARTTLNLPPSFWTLAPNTRQALGLRLLRGMSTPLIAQALRLTLSATQTLLVDGGRALAGDTGFLPEACRECWNRRLDDLAAERSHLLTCASCHGTIPHWEQAERVLAEQLGCSVGSLPLPRAIDETLLAALDTNAQSSFNRMWHRPVVLQSGLVLCLLAGLLVLFWPRSTATRPSTATAALTPAAIIAAARSNYTTAPPAAGIVHRRWDIALGQPQLNFVAEEWVDPKHPERHRMQLVADGTVAEWQVGDGLNHLLYMSNLVPYFCGASPTGVQSHTNERNSWPLSPGEQAAMRTARWQHGPWATGLHYLDLAATADTIRSLGIGGSGAAAVLTLSAEGHTISGTLLLRFDPQNHMLREVHEISRNNGQTEDRVPWQLVSSETLDEQTTSEQNLLATYPSDNRPPLVDRTLPVVDQGCPLSGSQQIQSLPQLLTVPSLAGALVGLPELPHGLDHALVIGPADTTAAEGFSQRLQLDSKNVEVVYFGPSKRLVFLPEIPPVERDHLVTAGAWRVHFYPQEVPTVLTAVLQHIDSRDPQFSETRRSGLYVHVLAEGWTREELLTVLASARPLTAEDWVSTPDRFYEPVALSPTNRAHLTMLFKAARTFPGQTHHQIKLETTRQAPFLADLHDPYHIPNALWPVVRREESWIEHGADNREHQALRITSDTAGHVLYAQWHDDQIWHTYDALSNSVISQPFVDRFMVPSDGTPTLDGALQWQWRTLPDGTEVAEQPQPLESYRSNIASSVQGAVYLDNWIGDLGTDTGINRRTFDATGNFLGQETVAILGAARAAAQNDLGLPATPPTSTVTINRTVIEQNEWLSNVPTSTFTWTTPLGAKEMSADELQTFYHNLRDRPVVRNEAGVAASMPFPIWSWFASWLPPAEAPKLSGILYQPPLNGAFLPVMQGTIGSAVNLGVAIDSHYLLDNRSVDILQGPALQLRQLLQQTAPNWTSAEQRIVSTHGQPHIVWLMRGTTQKSGINIYYNRWIVFEMEGTLFFIRADLQDVDVDKIVQHLDGLRRVIPQQLP